MSGWILSHFLQDGYDWGNLLVRIGDIDCLHLKPYCKLSDDIQNAKDLELYHQSKSHGFLFQLQSQSFLIAFNGFIQGLLSVCWVFKKPSYLPHIRLSILEGLDLASWDYCQIDNWSSVGPDYPSVAINTWSLPNRHQTSVLWWCDFVNNHRAHFCSFHLCYYVIADALSNHFH